MKIRKFKIRYGKKIFRDDFKDDYCKRRKTCNNCIFKNLNNRCYPPSVMEKMLKDFKSIIKKDIKFGTLDHPSK